MKNTHLTLQACGLVVSACALLLAGCDRGPTPPRTGDITSTPTPSTMPPASAASR